MIDFELIKEKKIALVIWNTEKENDVKVFVGEIIQENDNYKFINESQNWHSSLTPEVYERLREVPEELREMLLDAEFAISLTIGSLPNDSIEGFVPTGMKWK